MENKIWLLVLGLVLVGTMVYGVSQVKAEDTGESQSLVNYKKRLLMEPLFLD